MFDPDPSDDHLIGDQNYYGDFPPASLPVQLGGVAFGIALFVTGHFAETVWDLSQTDPVGQMAFEMGMGLAMLAGTGFILWSGVCSVAHTATILHARFGHDSDS